MFRGYDKADKIVQELCVLLKDNPMTEKNVTQWLRFARTVTSSAQLIYDEAMRFRKEMRAESIKEENRRHSLCQSSNFPLEEGERTIYKEEIDDYYYDNKKDTTFKSKFERKGKNRMKELTRTVVNLIYEYIKEAGEEGIPSGHLYSLVMEMLSLDIYSAVISVLKQERKIKESNYILTSI